MNPIGQETTCVASRFDSCPCSLLALKVSYAIRFDNLPEPGFETTDRLLTTALQLTL